MRNLILAGAIAILAVPASIGAQTPGTPPADPTGSNTASANNPAQPMPNATSGMGDTANPMAGDTHTSTTTTPPSSSDTGTAPSGNGAMPDSSTNASPPPDAGMKTYPMCSKTVHDECRNRGGK